MSEFSPGSPTEMFGSFASSTPEGKVPLAVHDAALRLAPWIPHKIVINKLIENHTTSIRDLPKVIDELSEKYPKPTKRPPTYVEDPNPFSYQSSNK